MDTDDDEEEVGCEEVVCTDTRCYPFGEAYDAKSMRLFDCLICNGIDEGSLGEMHLAVGGQGFWKLAQKWGERENDDDDAGVAHCAEAPTNRWDADIDVALDGEEDC